MNTLIRWKVRLNNPAAIVPGHTINEDNDGQRPVGLALHYPGRPEVGIANARLMTAAPELFTTLKRLEPLIAHHADMTAHLCNNPFKAQLKLIRAAIAKVEGGKP